VCSISVGHKQTTRQLAKSGTGRPRLHKEMEGGRGPGGDGSDGMVVFAHSATTTPAIGSSAPPNVTMPASWPARDRLRRHPEAGRQRKSLERHPGDDQGEGNAGGLTR